MSRGRWRSAALACLLGLAGPGLRPGHAQTPVPSGPATHVLVVTGLGGTPEYTREFETRARSLIDAARDRWGVPGSRLRWLAEDPAHDPERIAGKSTREGMEAEIRDLAARAGPEDAVLILLIGHGSAAGDEARFHLPGPDVGARELSSWLDAFPTQTVAVVNVASASGGFVPAVSGERRIVVAATRSGRESERTHFGTYFVEAFTGEGADTDKDGRVSLLEAFTYGRREVERFYETDRQMLTEHAILDDNGDGEGSGEPSPSGIDGRLASGFHLAPAVPSVAGAAADPELARLLATKRRIEADIARLRVRKERMAPADYEAELESLLVALAGTNRAIRAKEGGP